MQTEVATNVKHDKKTNKIRIHEAWASCGMPCQMVNESHTKHVLRFLSEASLRRCEVWYMYTYSVVCAALGQEI
jgi:hypothetical protein